MISAKRIKIKNSRQFGTKKDMILDVIKEGADYYICNVLLNEKTDVVRVKKENCEIVSWQKNTSLVFSIYFERHAH